MWNWLLLLFVASSTVCEETSAVAEAAVPPAELEARLERVVSRLEEQRVKEHIAGMSLAVVVDDEVVLTHGFGLADVETKRPVTEDTLFGIGSTTKAFTATLIGMLVDEGKMDFDDPVVEHLPYFDIDTGDSGQSATLRDLLSHRSGFTRMSMLSTAPNVTRKRILETAATAVPFAPFRKEFHYNNVMFLAAGVAAGAAAESTWDELIEERVFSPLGMEDSSTTYAAAVASDELSMGYLFDEDTGELDSKKIVNIDGIGPAGSINSNAKDMAQWLRLLLGRGEVEGKRLISEDSLQTTWTAQMPISGGVSYGLGWMLHDWRGQPVVEHGGNIEGFAAQVALLPESRIGFALLTNASVTSLQAGSMEIVFDSLLGEQEVESAVVEAGAEAIDYSEYVGAYIANFATFDGAEFTVQVDGDQLAVDVPGQTLYALKQPDEEGKWTFELTDQIAVSFERDESGEVTLMKMYQAGFAFELPREGVEIEAEIPIVELQRFLGAYESEDGRAKGTIIVQNNRLAIDVPGEMVFELHVPDDDGRRAFRIRPEIAVSFNESEDGRVESLTFHRPDAEKVFVRKPDEGSAMLPTIDDLMALRKPDERIARMTSSTKHLKGTGSFVNSGLRGRYDLYIDGTTRYAECLDFGDFGQTSTTIAGDQGWVIDPLRGVTAMDGDELVLSQLGHPAVEAGDWRDTYDSVVVQGFEEVDGKRSVRVKLTKEDLPSATLFVDAETGDVLKSESVIASDMVQLPVETRYSDFRDGVPYRVELENDWNGLFVIEIESIESGADLDASMFEMPATED